MKIDITKQTYNHLYITENIYSMVEGDPLPNWLDYKAEEINPSPPPQDEPEPEILPQ